MKSILTAIRYHRILALYIAEVSLALQTKHNVMNLFIKKFLGPLVIKLSERGAAIERTYSCYLI